VSFRPEVILKRSLRFSILCSIVEIEIEIEIEMASSKKGGPIYLGPLLPGAAGVPGWVPFPDEAGNGETRRGAQI
jgi:hypothetical protein